MTRGVAGWLVVLGAATLVTVTPAAAQVGTPVERDCVCVDDLRDRVMRQVRVATRHARIGAVIGDREEVAGRHGVRVARVPEGSPAYRAGLRAGDVILQVDGHDLGTDPAAGLLERLSHTTPGDTVEVSFVRDGQEHTARVATEEGGIMQALGDGLRFQIPAMGRGLERDDMLIRARRDGLRLAAVNPELGAYFGTDRGVLVTAVDGDSSLDLRPGDVVLAVGDREVRDPAHLRAILASYRDDETVTLRIVREERTQQITTQR